MPDRSFDDVLQRRRGAWKPPGSPPPPPWERDFQKCETAAVMSGLNIQHEQFVTAPAPGVLGMFRFTAAGRDFSVVPVVDTATWAVTSWRVTAYENGLAVAAFPLPVGGLLDGLADYIISVGG